MAIHPTAIVDKSAEIDPTAEIGAYAVVEANTKIGAETRLYPHAYVSWGTTLGSKVQIHPFAVVGHLPQDFAFDNSPSYTEIGDGTIIREHATVHRGTIPESKTIVGKNCLIMTTGHVAHNCVVGDNVVIVNAGLLAGHVKVGDNAFLAGHAGVHQFVRIGESVIVRGLSPVTKDVPPFMMVGPKGVVGVNIVGMRRRGFTSAERQEVRECHKILYRSGMHFPRAVEHVLEMVSTEPGKRLATFFKGESRRGYQRYQLSRRSTTADLED